MSFPLARNSNVTSFVYLSRLIEKTILRAYKLVCQTQLSTAGTSSASSADSNLGSSNRSFINLPKELFEMLASAGPYLYRDALLLQKVCQPDPGILVLSVAFSFS